MTTETKIDPAAIEQVLSLGGQSLLARLVAIFMDVGPTRLTAAKAALEGGDLKAVHRELHSIRSSAGNLGCIGVSSGCLAMEYPILNDETADFASLMIVLDSEMTIAQAELQELAKSTD
jgi:HPt (histidine-containing phosphotransfer) domain-containing protein